MVDFVEDVDGGGVFQVELGEDVFDFGDFLRHVWVACVDDVEDEIGVDGFVEGGAESLDELGWKVLDESDGVGEEDGGGGRKRIGYRVLSIESAGGDPHFSHARIEGGEKFVGYVGAFFGERVEEGGFTGVGVADDGDRFEAEAIASVTVKFARASHAFEFFFDVLVFFGEMTLHELGVGFALSTTDANAAYLLHHLHTHAKDTWTHVIDGGEFDL